MMTMSDSTGHAASAEGGGGLRGRAPCCIPEASPRH